MPRQIIDTESSRPRYVRRIAIQVAVLVVVVAIALVVAFEAYARYAHVVPGK